MSGYMLLILRHMRDRTRTRLCPRYLRSPHIRPGEIDPRERSSCQIDMTEIRSLQGDILDPRRTEIRTGEIRTDHAHIPQIRLRHIGTRYIRPIKLHNTIRLIVSVILVGRRPTEIRSTKDSIRKIRTSYQYPLDICMRKIRSAKIRKIHTGIVSHIRARKIRIAHIRTVDFYSREIRSRKITAGSIHEIELSMTKV